MNSKITAFAIEAHAKVNQQLRYRELVKELRDAFSVEPTTVVSKGVLIKCKIFFYFNCTNVFFIIFVPIILINKIKYE